MVVSPAAALEKAHQQGSPDAASTLRLAALELEGGRPREALRLYQQVLSGQPAHVAALQGAARSAEACGDEATLVGYRRLLDALGEAELPAVSAAVPEPGPLAASSPAPVSSPTPRVRLRIVKGEEETAFDELAPVHLSDVIGQEPAKARLRDLVLSPPASPSTKRQLRGGVLLWGAPGCGKTFLARALAGELGARCLRVSLANLCNSYVWDSERKLQGTLGAVRGRSPAVLMFDDLDALTPRQHDPGAVRTRRLVTRFLLGLCDLLAQEKQLFVLATTAQPWDVEPRLRRAGRFDQPVFVSPPDVDTRTAILREHARASSGADIDFPRLARQTEHMSIADLQKLFREAGDGESPHALHTVDLLRALPKVRASTREWLEGARNFALFPERRSDYDELRLYLQTHAL